MSVDDIIGGVAHALGGGETISERARDATEYLQLEERMAETLARADALLEQEGLDTLSPRSHPIGDLVWPRRHEVAAALSRLRTLSIAP